MFYYAILRGVIGETTRDNPLYVWHYLNPHWGIGFTTLMQLFTPPILMFTGLMMRRTWRTSSRSLPELVARESPPSPPVPEIRVGRRLVLATGTLSIIGGVLFELVLRVPAVAVYLIAAGVFFDLMALRWPARYREVATTPPEGYRATGERYVNPGAGTGVGVWARGLRLIYVQDG
jgi:hypothetical protein